MISFKEEEKKLKYTARKTRQILSYYYYSEDQFEVNNKKVKTTFLWDKVTTCRL